MNTETQFRAALLEAAGSEEVLRKVLTVLGNFEPDDDFRASLHTLDGGDVHWGYSCHMCGGLTEGWVTIFNEG